MRRVLAEGWYGYYEPDAVVVHRQWRGRRAAVRRSYAYGRGQAAAGAGFREAVWHDGLRPAVRDLRAGYVTGVGRRPLPGRRCHQLAGPPPVTTVVNGRFLPQVPGGLQRTARSLLTALKPLADLEVVSPVSDPLADVVLPRAGRPGRRSAVGAGPAAAARPRPAGAVAGQHRAGPHRRNRAGPRPRAAGRAAVVRTLDAPVRPAGPRRRPASGCGRHGLRSGPAGTARPRCSPGGGGPQRRRPAVHPRPGRLAGPGGARRATC